MGEHVFSREVQFFEAEISNWHGTSCNKKELGILIFKLLVGAAYISSWRRAMAEACSPIQLVADPFPDVRGHGSLNKPEMAAFPI
ncbi:MAG: hypothetical protein J2P21_03090 [Chloracidobacterium sp.]|nr:hypothetical protein [Chloracidobacterium sp.]